MIVLLALVAYVIAEVALASVFFAVARGAQDIAKHIGKLVSGQAHSILPTGKVTQANLAGILPHAYPRESSGMSTSGYKVWLDPSQLPDSHLEK
jgi:hypothetical protein